MKRIYVLNLISVIFIAFLLSSCQGSNVRDYYGLTLIPAGTVTNKIDLDIRGGVINKSDSNVDYTMEILISNGDNTNSILTTEFTLAPKESKQVKHILPTKELLGDVDVTMKISSNLTKDEKITKSISVVDSDIRSTRLIDGAWAGIYHWSEQEGKHWNKDIKNLTENQWMDIVSSMHKLGMNMIVIQEMFRNNDYVGDHNTTVENYSGKSFYPSNLYEGRMPITAKDPLEAILSRADELNMNVMVGIGMFAWFDFTEESLKWHKMVSTELWEKYSHHKSFYGFYVSEECAGNLYNSETEPDRIKMRKDEIVYFFQEFKKHTQGLAPDKPVMLATNSMGVPFGADTYPLLLEHLDILCPFGFARMPEDDLTGKQAADLLQALCDNKNAHLWFDLEAFLFNPDMSLYPRPIEQIVNDLNLLDNFEKILCYQFPGVFNDPSLPFIVGESRTQDLFNDYQAYRKNINNN